MRKNAGRETWHALLKWDRGQAVAERMAAQVVLIEGLEAVDPSHPLGGPDGLMDIICEKNGIDYIVAAYFPRGQQSFSEIKSKFLHDYEGVSRNGAKGFVFITNQELHLSERDELGRDSTSANEIQIYHLERLATLLNSPKCYGIRLEFLDIEMTKEEQLSFIALRDCQLSMLLDEQKTILQRVDEIIDSLKKPDSEDFEMLSKLKEFREILNQISGENRYTYSYFSSGHISKLSVPLSELVEFKRILDSITGNSFSLFDQGKMSSLRVPLKEMQDFSEILTRVTSQAAYGPSNAIAIWGKENDYGKISDLKVPVADLKEYEGILNRIVQKLKEMREMGN